MTRNWKRTTGTFVAASALAVGMSVATAPAATADTFGCEVSVSHLGVSSDTDGRWVSATATLTCDTTAWNYIHVNLALERNGEILTLEPNGVNSDGWPSQYRNCPEQRTCTISVAARASEPAATYTASASGWLIGAGETPSELGETVYGSASVVG